MFVSFYTTNTNGKKKKWPNLLVFHLCITQPLSKLFKVIGSECGVHVRTLMLILLVAERGSVCVIGPERRIWSVGFCAPRGLFSYANNWFPSYAAVARPDRAH